jgi:hypothetical protein
LYFSILSLSIIVAYFYWGVTLGQVNQTCLPVVVICNTLKILVLVSTVVYKYLYFFCGNAI